MKTVSMLLIEIIVEYTPHISMFASFFVSGNPSPVSFTSNPPFSPEELGDTEAKKRFCTMGERESDNGTTPYPSMFTTAL